MKCLVTLILTALCLCSCVRHIYDTNTEYIANTDTVYKSLIQRDSIVVRDSVLIRQAGDTVYYTKFRDRLKVVERLDTIYQSVRDTIYVTEEKVIKEPRTVESKIRDIVSLFIALLIIGLFVALGILKSKQR